MRYAFYVSGNASALKRLLKNPNIAAYLSEFYLVVSDNPKDESLVRLCAEKKVELRLINNLSTDRSNKDEVLSVALLEELDRYSIDYCFVYGTRILVGPVLDKYANRLINFHPSILPAYKGLRAVDRAIDGRSFLLGNTAHFITTDIDGGPVIMQNIISYQNFTSVEDLINNQNVMQMQIINWISQGRFGVSDGRAYVINADYSIGNYVPKIEGEIISMFG